MLKRTMTAIMVLTALCACGAKDAVRFPPNRWLSADDRRPQDMPKIDEKKIELNAVDQEMYSEVEWLESAGSSLGFQFLTVGTKFEALDTDNFDEVIDSTWFFNRIGRKTMSAAQIAAGPAPGERMSESGPLQVTAARYEGEMPRLMVRDVKGKRYGLKLELPRLKGIPTGAEVISSLILGAAGYNVPLDYISMVDIGRLTPAAGAVYRDEYARINTLDSEVLARIVGKAALDKKGQARAVVSVVPEGTLMGPFSFDGKRHGDRNDRLPHEHRRELRAYKLFAAMQNNMKSAWGSTMDMFVRSEGEKGYLLHYIYDFSGTFGRTGDWAEIPAPEPPGESGASAFLGIVTLGLVRSEKEAVSSKYGFLGPVGFNPEKWRPAIDNAASSFMTRADAFWAGRVIMRFSDEVIDAIVARAELPDAEVRRYVAAALKARRDMIGRYAFALVNPLDEFELENTGGAAVVTFEDLALKYGFEKQQGTEYRSMLRGQMGRAELTPWQKSDGRKAVVGADAISKVKPRKLHTLRIQTRRQGEQWWGPSVDLYVERDGDGLKLLGLKRRYFH